MGADGGVIWIALKKGTIENYARVCELIQPFWQLTSQDGGAYWAEEANAKWEEENISINAPKYLIGLYGTDRCDNFDLEDLYELYAYDDPGDYRGDFYALTFDELDLECRTSPFPVTRNCDEHLLRRLWYEHFKSTSRDDVLIALGKLADMTISAWATELRGLLDGRAVQEETWT